MLLFPPQGGTLHGFLPDVNMIERSADGSSLAVSAAWYEALQAMGCDPDTNNLCARRPAQDLHE
jgi:hypothetical protein